MSSQSPGPGGNAIRIPVVIETDAANAALVKLRRTAETEATAAGKAIGSGLAGGGSPANSPAVQVPQQAAKATEEWGASIKRASPLLANLRSTLTGLGASVSPAVGGITNAFGNLLMHGLNPVSLALIGGTGLIALMSNLGEETKNAGKAAEEAAERTERLAVAQGKVRSAIERAFVAQAGGGAAGELALANRMLENVERESAMAGSRLAAGNYWSDAERKADEELLREYKTRRIELINEIAALEIAAKIENNDRLERVDAEYWRKQGEKAKEAVRVAAEAKRAIWSEVTAGITGDSTDAKKFEHGLKFSFGPAAPDMEQIRPREVADWQKRVTEAEKSLADAMRTRQGLALEIQSIETGTARNVLELETQISEKAAEIAALRDDPLRAREIPIMEQELEILREQLGIVRRINAANMGDESGSDAVPAPRVDPQRESFGRGIENATSSALSAALTNPKKLKGAFQMFAQSLAQSITDAIADGLVAKAGAKKTGEAIFDAVSSFVGGGPSGDAGGSANAAAAAKSYSPGQPIVVVNTFDSASADAMMAKASASGARTFLARSQGNGVTAGVVQPRRRR